MKQPHGQHSKGSCEAGWVEREWGPREKRTSQATLAGGLGVSPRKGELRASFSTARIPANSACSVPGTVPKTNPYNCLLRLYVIWRSMPIFQMRKQRHREGK